ncbi:DUF6124 family protein [Pseudomonas sp. P2757]|uniref:DUF6124 family protein n=1 Tax=unclassified Pseudomonas TaxID=196821 RepID=UPI003B59A19A
MKKDSAKPVDELPQSKPETLELSIVPKPVEAAPAVREQRRQRLPLDQILSVRTDVDLPTLLAHAYEMLAAVNALALDFAGELTPPQRQKLMAIQQLTMLAEMLVLRACETVDPLKLATRPTSPVRH